MRVLKSKIIALLGAAILIVAACGSSTANPVDPVGGVAAAFDAARSGGVLKQMDLVTCLTTGGAIGSAFSGLFGGFTGDALAQAGISSDDLSAAWKISFDNLQTTETSKSGETATVHVTVKVASAIDAGRMRDLMKKYLASQGVVPDDATLDAALAKIVAQSSQSETITNDISVVQQNGTWVACGGALTAAGTGSGSGQSSAGPNTLPTPSEVAQATEAVPSYAPSPSGIASAPATPNASGSATIPNVSGSTIAITAGNGFACALISDGSVKCWGKNGAGQLGNGTTTDSPTPISPSGLGAGVKSISADPFSSFACAVSADRRRQVLGHGHAGAGFAAMAR